MQSRLAKEASFRHCERCNSVQYHSDGVCPRCHREDLLSGAVPWNPSTTPEEREAQWEASKVALERATGVPYKEPPHMPALPLPAAAAPAAAAPPIVDPPPKRHKGKRSGRPPKAKH